MSAPRVSLWSDLECVTGARELGPLAALSLTWSEQTDGSDACDAVVRRDGRTDPQLGDVVRIERGSTVWEYRVATVQRTENAAEVQIGGVSPLLDLSTAGTLYVAVGGRADYAITRRALLDDLLGETVFTRLAEDGLTHWSYETTGDTRYETLAAPTAGWTRLEWLRAIADRYGRELRAVRDGASGYIVRLPSQLGTDAPPVRIVEGRNLLAYADQRDDAESATAVTVLGPIPAGDVVHSGIAENEWTLGAIPGSAPYWIPLTDAAGGAPPIAFDGQLVGAFLLRSDAGTTEILETRRSDSAVRVGATTGLTEGDKVQVVADATGARLVELTRPSARRVHRKEVLTTGESGRSLLRNSLFLNWTNAFTPDQWSTQGTGTIHLGEYPRDLPTSYSGVVLNGAHSVGATGVSIRGLPPFTRLYYGESIQVAGDSLLRVGNVVAVADASGVVGIVFLTGALSGNRADGTAVTLMGTAPTRPPVLPDEPDPNAALRVLYVSGNSITVPPPATALRVQSENVTCKYVAGALAQVNAAVAYTVVGGTAETGNLNGGTITDDLSAATSRILPGLMLRNQGTNARMAWSAIGPRVPAGATVNAIVACSATLTADTQVAACLLPPNVSAQAMHVLARWCTVWLGPQELVLPRASAWDNTRWQRANAHLVARQLATAQFRLSLLDLSTVAGYSVSREQLVLGNRIEVNDSGLTLRVLGMTFNADRPEAPELIVDARPRRLVQLLTERLGL